MHAWMYGWMNGWMCVCMHACMHGWMYVCMEESLSNQGFGPVLGHGHLNVGEA